MIPFYIALVGLAVYFMMKFLPKNLNDKKAGSEEKTEVKKEEKKPVASPKEGPFKGYRLHMVLGLLAILAYFYVPTLREYWDNMSQQGRVAGPVVHAGVVYQRQQEHCVLSWVMPEGMDGINPKQRSLSMGVTMGRNDDEVMEFSGPGGTEFTWDKSKKQGMWYDSKGATGGWSLSKDGSGYKGEVTDNLNEAAPMTLECH